MTGSDGGDTFYAVDGTADTSISGGPGVDTAYYDLGIDPNPTATENKYRLRRPAAASASASAASAAASTASSTTAASAASATSAASAASAGTFGCTYDAATRTMRLDLGGPTAVPTSPTAGQNNYIGRRTDALGGAIFVYSQSSWTPTLRDDCGAATVTNTDVIEVVGQRDDVRNDLIIDNVFEYGSPEPADRRATDSSFAGSGIEFRIGVRPPAGRRSRRSSS